MIPACGAVPLDRWDGFFVPTFIHAHTAPRILESRSNAGKTKVGGNDSKVSLELALYPNDS